jgi:hypothetical protein
MSPTVFDILELPIVAGRNFSSAGDEDALLVNESLARDLWPGESPLGKVVLESTGERHVIGVVKDASVIHIGRIDPAAFRPIAVDRAASMLMITPAPATIAALTQIATRIDARARVRIDSIAGNVERQLGGLAAMATLAGVLGVIALVIAALGVFGVFAYTVQARTREIGIRTALGASPHQVAAVILRESTRAIVSGLAAGTFASLVTGRAIASELYGASIFDPAVLGATGLVLTIAGLLASWIPARRAADIDPVIALRDD